MMCVIMPLACHQWLACHSLRRPRGGKQSQQGQGERACHDRCNSANGDPSLLCWFPNSCKASKANSNVASGTLLLVFLVFQLLQNQTGRNDHTCHANCNLANKDLSPQFLVFERQQCQQGQGEHACHDGYNSANQRAITAISGVQTSAKPAQPRQTRMP